MTVYELIQKLSRYDSDTPVYLVPVENVQEGVCKVYDVDHDRLADNRTEIVLIQGDNEEYEITMADIYDKIEHGEYYQKLMSKTCSCGGIPEMVYNTCTGKHGVLCPDCGKLEPPIYFSKRDAIGVWNEKNE